MQLLIQKNNELYRKQSNQGDPNPPFITQPTPFGERKASKQLPAIPSTEMAVRDLGLHSNSQSGITAKRASVQQHLELLCQGEELIHDQPVESTASFHSVLAQIHS